MAGDLDVVSIGECMAELSEREDGLFARSFGGDALNTVVACARLGLRCGFVSDVGDDPFGESLLRAWRRESVEVFGERVARPNGVYFILRSRGGRPPFHYLRRGSAAAATLRPGRLGPIGAFASRARFFHVTGITAATTERPDLLLRLVARVRRRATVTLDVNDRPALWSAREARRALSALLPHVDLLFASEEDERRLHPGRGVDAVLRHYLRQGVSAVFLKQGARGCTLASGGRRWRVPAARTKVVDTTGAGDAFNGGVLAGLCRDLPLWECALLGTAAAAAKVRSRGAVGPTLRRDRVERIFRELRSRPVTAA